MTNQPDAAALAAELRRDPWEGNPAREGMMLDPPAPATLAEHFPTGLRSKRGYLPQTGEVFESPIQCECPCGAAQKRRDAIADWHERQSILAAIASIRALFPLAKADRP